jgi:hypothetical protein
MAESLQWGIAILQSVLQSRRLPKKMLLSEDIQWSGVLYVSNDCDKIKVDQFFM